MTAILYEIIWFYHCTMGGCIDAISILFLENKLGFILHCPSQLTPKNGFITLIVCHLKYSKNCGLGATIQMLHHMSICTVGQTFDDNFNTLTECLKGLNKKQKLQNKHHH